MHLGRIHRARGLAAWLLLLLLQQLLLPLLLLLSTAPAKKNSGLGSLPLKPGFCRVSRKTQARVRNAIRNFWTPVTRNP